jgi:hypothetical protein
MNMTLGFLNSVGLRGPGDRLRFTGVKVCFLMTYRIYQIASLTSGDSEIIECKGTEGPDLTKLQLFNYVDGAIKFGIAGLRGTVFPPPPVGGPTNVRRIPLRVPGDFMQFLSCSCNKLSCKGSINFLQKKNCIN